MLARICGPASCCAPRDRPWRRAAEQRDELASPHGHSLGARITPYHIVEKPCCASQHFGPPEFRNGSKRESRSDGLMSAFASCGHLVTYALGSNVPLIGIGGSLAAPPLPHHLAYGSVPRRFEKLG